MRTDSSFNPPDSTRGVFQFLETQCDRAMARSRQTQFIGLVSAVAAAALLLLLVVALSVPGFPVAASIVVGVLFALSIVALTASFLLYIANAKLVAIRIKFLSSGLQDHFSESSILGTLRKGRGASIPLISGQADDPLPNRIGIKKSAEMRVLQKGIGTDYKKYKQHLDRVNNDFTFVCEGISALIPTEKDAPFPIEPSHLVGVFLVSFSPDKNPILKITRHAEKMLQPPQGGFPNGLVWLCGALSDPKKFAAPFLSLIEKTHQRILVSKDLKDNKERKLVLEASLLSLNIFFSGWCLGNPEYNQYITTAVAEKYKDVSVRNCIYDFLDTGNVISALALASSYSQDSAWAAGLQKVLREEDKKTKKKSREEEVSCLYRDIDPGCCLRALPKRFESKSSGGQGSPKEQLSSLLKALDQKIPSGILGLIAKASSADLKADFAGMLEVIKQLQALFDSYPPLCEDNILLWLSASLEQVDLQKKLRTFLPSSEKKLLERVLSTFLLGLYTRGVFSVGQVNQLATICNTQDSTEFCQRVSDLSLIKRTLPALFG
ncbi:CT214 family putative inclusion membrane protein [Chlamydia trachomatis]|uniref:CT214 family putative inclusion membrane protein n=1 Tax=Chlamydia trachomatis TaxID=813 RepID=UPI0001A35107|nr:hypothetical protein [Chlamydia trachomatis]CAX09769.1 candidate inclusion membrane protein [Chlamydia trachomatis B/TZ1A828/OT]